MSDTPNHISRVEIKGLWGRYDLTWDLNDDVNVLSGKNGSGKSTILNCIYALMKNNRYPNQNWDRVDGIGSLITRCKIRFDNEDDISYEFLLKDDETLEGVTRDAKGITRYSASKHHIYSSSKISSFPSYLPQIDLINTFDDELKSLEAISKLSDENVKTNLDWEIYHLQRKYVDYQLSNSRKIIELLGKGAYNKEILATQQKERLFLNILDSLFKSTNKKVDRSENEISFLLGEEKISPYQLSSGEKQLLVILLTVLVQDNKNAILFLDEPEISLHFDWQKKLIQYIRELNPNVQIILATHSPAVIMEGWMDKVFEVSDLIHMDHKSGTNV